MRHYKKLAEHIVKLPNEVDTKVVPLMKKLRAESYEMRRDVMKVFAVLVVETACTDSTVRHSLSRMTNVLLDRFSRSRRNVLMGEEFWAVLKSLFEREVENGSETLANNAIRYKTFAFYLAEVLGTSSRMFGYQRADELSDLILAMLKDFFATGVGEQWKTGGQVLKQVGAYLEDNFAKRKDSNGVSDLDEFMEEVDKCGKTVREEIPFYIRSMLINIMELRAYDWGRRTTPEPPSAPPPKNNQISNDLAARFLSGEERRFLEAQGCVIDVNDDYFNGMDDEMERDYELFLEMSANGGQ
jgi:hypothetical protein